MAPRGMANDFVSVCKGGKVGMDSDAAKATLRGLDIRREYSGVKMLIRSPNAVLSFKTTLQVPKPPTQRQTLFIWPGLQSRDGAADPGRVGNGVLQPVLTWGGSCAPKAPSNPLAAIFKKPLRRDVLVGTALAVIATFGYQGAIQWVPSWINSMLHAQGAKSVIPQVSLITSVLNFGGMIGCIVFPFVAERLSRKTALLSYFLGALVFVPTTFFLAATFTQASCSLVVPYSCMWRAATIA